MSNNVVTVIVNDGRTYVSRVDYKTLMIQSDGRNIESLSGAEHWDGYVFNHVFNDETDKVIRINKEQKTTQKYVIVNPHNSAKPIIDENVYSKLPVAIQSLYKEEKVLEDNIIEYDVNLIDVGNISVDVVSYTRQEVLANINRFANLNKRALITVSRGILRSGDKGLEIKFFDRDYNGEKKKVLDLKKDGRPYSDRRGRYVNDYPTIVASYSIDISDIPYFSARNQEELDAKMKEYVNHITMAEFLEKELQ